jgi:hypothetical protein
MPGIFLPFASALDRQGDKFHAPCMFAGRPKRRRVISDNHLDGVVGRGVRAGNALSLSGNMMTDPALLQVLASYYRAQADVCYQMAEQASERFSQDWLDLAERWMKLARHAEAGTFPTSRARR